ncbi:MAG: response regulator receiver protein [Pedosphaera sp.]|jgi:CheY-like chemotaxis protein|nr:response regulator receiver protein [Pedosphaera sp.]
MQNHTILVAEDNDDDTFFLRRALEKSGVQADLQIVADGEQAIAYLHAEGEYSNRQKFPFPCLVLLDIKMPKMNGFEVLDAIRRDHNLRRLVVVFLTSSDQVRDINLAADLAVNSYLVKAPDLDFLSQLLRRLEEYWLSLHKRATIFPQ